MILNKIIIKNYKSIQNIELNLSNLNVFVGLNNAGKSNIFDCLNFLAQFIMNGEVAISQRGGFSNIVWNGELDRDIIIQVDLLPYSYRIEIAPVFPSSYCIQKEVFSIVKPVETNIIFKELWTVKIQEKEVSHIKENKISILPAYEHISSCAEFIDFIKGWNFYNQETLNSLILTQKGENISQLLLNLHSKYPEEYKRIEEMLQSAINEIDFLLPSAIQEKDLKIKIPAWSMSEGTLRLLAYLSALYTPIKPTLACLEAPENYIHLHLLEYLSNAFKNARDNTQILISTYSPYLLNLFGLENLIIVEKKRGATQIKYAKDEKGIKDALITLGLGKLWYSGSLGGIPE